MRAGRLLNKFEIWASTVPEGTGGDAGTPTWVHVGDAWGSLDGLSSREAFERGAIGSTTTHTIVCRYTTLITAQTKLMMGTRDFRVDGSPVDPNGRRRELRIGVTERTS